ncbi:amidohydrolase family protein [Pseudomonas cichorii]|nr:amidohydrolase family protein [Pseudomonas cichorii]MBX8512563.1 amidohydrolase family protein [Pseudomonas cichorii]MBX8525392.1 amidohydrolase family protein [Pseudomonas cichorii]
MALSRRRFLQAGSALSALASMGVLANVPFSRGDAPPRHSPPAGSVDCHMHLYDGRYPAVANAKLLPDDASLEDYRQLLQRLGMSRMVIVTPSTYGTDNRILLDGLLRSQGNARGIAVVDPSISAEELGRLHDAGVRGIRFNFSTGNTSLDDLEKLAPRVNELGWNVQVACGPHLVELEPHLARLQAKLVIDHMGHVPHPEGVKSDAFASLTRLLDNERTWIKLSAPYIRSLSGAPDYEDSGKVASALIMRNAERMLWGSDWPHPTQAADRKPDDAAILDLMWAWAGDEKKRTSILRDNPVSLYGF